MLGLGKKKPLDDQEFRDSMRAVEDRILQGDYTGATGLASALAKTIEANNGSDTLAWALARALQARVALARGDHEAAVEHLVAATEVEGASREAIEARLEHQMRLGDVLSELGQLEEAERVHRDALAQRSEFYGETHPGYGYGAESLAIVLLRQRQYEEAEELGRAARRAFRAGDERKLAAAILLETLARKAQDPAHEAIEQLDDGDRGLLFSVMDRTPGYLFVDAIVDLRWEALTYMEDTDRRRACLKTLASHAEALDREADVQRARAMLDELDEA